MSVPASDLPPGCGPFKLGGTKGHWNQSGRRSVINIPSQLQLRAGEMIAGHGFQGVPQETFEQAGRQQFVDLLEAGLLPESKVLEFGCGCLRIAYWLVRFLDASCYYGIEPAWGRVERGRQYLFTPELLADKRPQFDRNAVFDSSVFNQKFDFFLARSIWTHASKPQIERTLDSFVRDASDQAMFLVSYLPAETPEDDYAGDTWVGTSHESDVPGIVRHSLQWIESQCTARNLLIEYREGRDCDSQYWMHIRRG